jgi:hypothetical protein
MLSSTLHRWCASPYGVRRPIPDKPTAGFIDERANEAAGRSRIPFTTVQALPEETVDGGVGLRLEVIS